MDSRGRRPFRKIIVQNVCILISHSHTSAWISASPPPSQCDVTVSGVRGMTWKIKCTFSDCFCLLVRPEEDVWTVLGCLWTLCSRGRWFPATGAATSQTKTVDLLYNWFYSRYTQGSRWNGIKRETGKVGLTATPLIPTHKTFSF